MAMINTPSKIFVIRRGVFETNSSSSHSISINKNSNYAFLKMLEMIEENRENTIIPLKTIQASTNEYYDDGEVLDNWTSKLTYILTSFQYFPGIRDGDYFYKKDKDSYSYDFDVNLLLEHPFIQILQEVIKRYKNYELSFDDTLSVGSIDHESTSIVSDFLGIRSEEDYQKPEVRKNLINFLFDDAITINLDGCR